MEQSEQRTSQLHSAAWLLCLGLCLTASPQTGRRLAATGEISGKRKVALVIGNANYPGHLLQNPLHDAEDVQRELQALGFTVTLGPDLSMHAMRDRIDGFLRDLREGDVALFYYSGHGMQIEGENLLVPVDFPAKMPGQVATAKAACYRFDDLQRAFESSRASLSIMVIDACRNNPYRTSRAWNQAGLAPVDAGLGSYIAFAASPGQTADDNSEERNGLFTKYFLKTLKQPEPLSQFFRTVREEVFAASRQSQRPYLVDQVIGDFWFSAASSVRPDPVRPPRAGQDLLEEGLWMYAQGNCTDALARFDQACRRNPENALAQNAAGKAYACLKQYSRAIERYGMAIELKPDLAAPYLNRGEAYFISGRYELAVEDYTWAAEEDPSNSVFYTRRGQAYFNLKKYDDALADFNRAIKLNPTGADAFHGRGQVLQRQGRYQDAYDDYMTALERNPSLTDVRKDLEVLARRLQGRN